VAHDGGTSFGERDGYGSADAGGSTGDQSHTAF
jgi:hypothetical protein